MSEKTPYPRAFKDEPTPLTVPMTAGLNPAGQADGHVLSQSSIAEFSSQLSQSSRSAQSIIDTEKSPACHSFEPGIWIGRTDIRAIAVARTNVMQSFFMGLSWDIRSRKPCRRDKSHNTLVQGRICRHFVFEGVNNKNPARTLRYQPCTSSTPSKRRRSSIKGRLPPSSRSPRNQPHLKEAPFESCKGTPTNNRDLCFGSVDVCYSPNARRFSSNSSLSISPRA